MVKILDAPAKDQHLHGSSQPYNFSPGGLVPLHVPDAHVVHTCRQDTHTCKIKVSSLVQGTLETVGFYACLDRCTLFCVLGREVSKADYLNQKIWSGKVCYLCWPCLLNLTHV